MPYTSRLWQFAVDAEHTQIVRYAVWRATTAADREKVTKVFNDLALPRLKKVSAEDAVACEAQGDVVSARQSEHLMSPDVDVVNVRRLIKRAFLAGLTGTSRVSIEPDQLAYPI
jgi:hypothetical protein